MKRGGLFDRILGWMIPGGASAEAIRGDLWQEFEERRKEGSVRAHIWYLSQGLSVVVWAFIDRVRGRSWSRGVPARHTPPSSPDLRGGVSDGLRVLRRSPGYSAAVIATLGLALALSVTVFSAVNGVLLRELPYPAPDEIVRIDRITGEGVRTGAVSYPDLEDWQRELEGFQALFGRTGFEGVWVADGVAEIWTGVSVTPGFLEVFGVRPVIGAGLGPSNGTPGSRSLMISHGLWDRRFGGDPNLAGSRITMNGETWEIVGVMPADFEYPTPSTDVWAAMPDSPFLENRGAGFLEVIGRLRSEVSFEVASAEVQSVIPAIDAQYAEWPDGVELRSYSRVQVEAVRKVMAIFMGAVGLVLLVSCANVSGLAIARTESRAGELAIRASLGADRGRLARQLLAESMTLALAGGVLGVGLAWGGTKLLLTVAPPDLPRREMIAIDPSVLLFAMGMTLLVGLIFGFLPALRGAATRASAAVRAARGGTLAGLRTQTALATIQIGMAVVLLSGAGLLLRSFAALSSVDPGFEARETLVVSIGLDGEPYASAEAVLDFHDRLLERVESLPEVETVGLSTHLPFSDAVLNASVVRDGEIYQRGQVDQLGLEMYSGDYFKTLGMPLRQGRLPSLDRGAQREVLINEAASELMFPGGKPLGQRFSFDVEEGQASPEESYFTVVGVVPDVQRQSLEEDVSPLAYYYLPDFRQHYGFISGRFFYLTVRGRSRPDELIPGVRAAVLELDPTLPLRAASSLEQLVRETTITQRFRTLVLTLFAGVGLVVALTGVFAVMAYGVARQRRAIGVRMALGASAGLVRRRVLTRAAGVVLGGSGVGLVVAWWASPVLSDALFSIPARDPVTMGIVAIVMVLGSLTAAWLPAHQASRVDPMSVLREE